MCVAAVTDYGTNVVLSSAAKLTAKRLDVDKYLLKKKVLTMLNGCEDHSINIYLRIKFHLVLLSMACSFRQNLPFLI